MRVHDELYPALKTDFLKENRLRVLWHYRTQREFSKEIIHTTENSNITSTAANNTVAIEDDNRI